MPRYLISFDAHAMYHIPAEDMPAVTNASRALVQDAINAGPRVGQLAVREAITTHISGTTAAVGTQ